MKKLLIQSQAVLLLSLCLACSKERTEVTDAVQTDPTEKAHPGKVGMVENAYLNGTLISYNKVEGDNVFQGDIIIPDEHLSQSATTTEGTGRTGGRWPNKIVYYKIDPALPNQSRVTQAIAHWEANTGLDFRVRTTQTAYITFRVGSGCSSSVGRTGSQQYINLASGCTTGNTIHEIGHAIGLWHEHTRADQSTYVNINYNNIQSGYEHNFRTYVERGDDGFDFAGGMDFGSVMMYGPYSFAINSRIPTITKKNGTTYSVQRNGLSSTDISTVNSMYP